MLNALEVVAGVRAACERLAEALDDFEHAIDLRANFPSRVVDQLELKPLRERGGLVEAAADLGVILDRATGWWASDAPPAFATDATSAAEGLLLLALRSCAAYDAPGEMPVLARCRFAEMHRPRFDLAAVSAAIKCELAVMARRPVPDPTALKAAVGGSGWWRDSEEWYRECSFEMRNRLPGNWDKMTPKEKADHIRQAWTDSGRSTQGEQSRAFEPSPCDVDILNVLRGVLLTAAEIAPKAGYSERHVKDRIKLLKKHGFVKNAGARRGYYRTDAPPPDLKFPAPER